jgi:hypothetical protein
MRHSIASVASLPFLATSILYAPAILAATPPEPPPPMAAPPPPATAAPAPPADGPPAVKSKWNLTIYGFIESDIIYDTTQSMQDNGGIPAIQKGGGYAGDHDRTTFTFRNSRIGFRMSAPEVGGVKASGNIEFDWFGNQPAGITEPAFWSNATMRSRHIYLKLESDYVDLLFGQTWNLFGWQTMFHPLTVDIQGVPGQLFGRTTQFRLSHMFKTDPINIELAAAAVRAPQRDSAAPDGQGGLRFLINDWKGVHTAGGGGANAVDPLSVGVSGVVRSFRVKTFAATTDSSNKATGWAISVDGMIPVLPATADHHGNALTLNGSLQTGTGFNDQYSGFTGFVAPAGFPALPNGMAFAPNIDTGLVTYDPQGNLHTIDWTSYLVGLQYYLPPSGNVFISANYARMKSGNIDSFGSAKGSIYNKYDWWDVNLFWNALPSTRFGLEYAFYKSSYADGSSASNNRAQFAGWFFF